MPRCSHSPTGVCALHILTHLPELGLLPTQLHAVPSFLTWLCAAPTQSPVCWVTLNPLSAQFEGHSFLPLRALPIVHPGLSKGGRGQGLVQVEGWRCQVVGRGDEGLVCLAWGRVAEVVGDERRGMHIDEPKCTCLESCALRFTRTHSNLVIPCSCIHVPHTSPLPIAHKP